MIETWKTSVGEILPFEGELSLFHRPWGVWEMEWVESGLVQRKILSEHHRTGLSSLVWLEVAALVLPDGRRLAPFRGALFSLDDVLTVTLTGDVIRLSSPPEA